ncbi:NAD(P)/FAD-dependent oxidoreductase [Limibacillus halophilus]
MPETDAAFPGTVQQKAFDAADGSAARELFVPDFKERPIWLDQFGTPGNPAKALPASVDLVIIGSGYTGLSAAIQTARGGRSTLVLDSGDLGEGCSTRNGAHISTSIKPSQESLAKRFGLERARAIRAEGRAALDWIADFVTREGIDCDFRRCGRFHAAHSPKSYEKIARAAEELQRLEGVECHSLPRGDQGSEIQSDFYHGGVVYPRFATLHPGKYHRGLLEKAGDSGAELRGNCPALNITGAKGAFDVSTPKGSVRARNVLVATNGYTGSLTPWLQRRVIPIGSYVIATEALPAETVSALFPSKRIVSDTRRVVYYYGPSPDGRRVIFGGRVSAGETDVRVSGPRLHAEMARIFPALADAKISHSWFGSVAYTFDQLPHCGEQDGLHYAMGYCGSGVSMASYLGMRMGLQILGDPEGRTAFDGLPFPTRPFYAGKPWFLPTAVAWYRWLDNLECAEAARSIRTR